jgi:hypothetical protein
MYREYFEYSVDQTFLNVLVVKYLCHYANHVSTTTSNYISSSIKQIKLAKKEKDEAKRRRRRRRRRRRSTWMIVIV